MKESLLTSIVLILSLTALISCGSKSGSALPPAHEIGLMRNQMIDIAGVVRQYHLYVPENPATADMIVLLHGNRGSSDQILGLDGTKAPYKIWMDIALRENLILLVPNGSVGSDGFQGWNDCRSDVSGTPDTDDVLFIRNTIDEINVEFQRQKTKVFVVGTSNGGLMTQRLADESPEDLLAIAVVVNSRAVNSECTESTAMLPALFMNGTEDPLVPYAGGQIASDRGEVFSTPDTVSYWATRNQLFSPGVETLLADTDDDDGSTVRIVSYSDSQNSVKLMHYEMLGGGHTEPSIAERYGPIYKLIVGTQNGDFEMAEAIWAFFAKQ